MISIKYGAFFSILGLEISNDDAKKLFENFDTDGSGGVNMEEFLVAIRVSGRHFKLHMYIYTTKIETLLKYI